MGKYELKWVVALSLAVALSMVGSRARASLSVGFTATGGTTAGSGGGNDAFYFTPNTNIAINSLGFFDAGTGVGETVNVGIYQVGTDSLLGSNSVTVTGLTSGFDYSTLTTPITLSAGTQYAVDAYSAAGTPEYNTVSSNVTPAPALSFDGYYYSFIPPSSLSLGTNFDSTSYFGPNFQYSLSSSIPEPTTLSLLGIATVGALGRRRRTESVELPVQGVAGSAT